MKHFLYCVNKLDRSSANISAQGKARLELFVFFAGWLQAGGDLQDLKSNFIFFLNYKWLFEYSLKESCIICVFMKQRKWVEVMRPLMKRIRHRFHHLRLQTEPFEKDKKKKKISKHPEADRCGRSLPCPATSTAWSCCVWGAAFKKH